MTKREFKEQVELMLAYKKRMNYWVGRDSCRVARNAENTLSTIQTLINNGAKPQHFKSHLEDITKALIWAGENQSVIAILL